MTYKLSAPTEVAIEVTKNCNLKCVQCFSWDSRFSEDEELSFDELKALGQKLSEMKVFSVVFSGGEPFLRKNFLELCDYYSKLNIDVGFSTNGTFLDDEACKKIVQFNLGRGLQVSIDGSCKDVHDKIRGKGSFEKVIQGIKNLVKNGVNPSIATTVLSYNPGSGNKLNKSILSGSC